MILKNNELFDELAGKYEYEAEMTRSAAEECLTIKGNAWYN